MKKLGVERRSATLYARVKPSNKKHVQAHAKNRSRSGVKCSEAEALDAIIEAHKQQVKDARV